jgi:4'-phosphopantetheinyl transferase EntD
MLSVFFYRRGFAASGLSSSIVTMHGRSIFECWSTGLGAPGDVSGAEVDDGHLVGVVLPVRTDQVHALDLEACPSQAPLRMHTWLGGRAALRLALRRFGVEPDHIGRTERGAPSLPEGLVGSLGHKTDIAVALAARADGWTRGVDVEQIREMKTSIEDRILRDEEKARWSELGSEGRDRFLLASFSIKEAVYKALDPHVARWVDYKECEVRFLPNSKVRVALFVPEARFLCEARLYEQAGYFVSTAKLRPAE